MKLKGCKILVLKKSIIMENIICFGHFLLFIIINAFLYVLSSLYLTN